MRSRRAFLIAQVAVGLLLGAILVSAAHDRARSNTLISFRHYRADWEDAWRAPVEHRAVDALGELLAHPDRDPEMAEAALSVLRRSPSWFAMAPDICSQLKGWLDVHLQRGDGDQLKPAYELLKQAESDEIEAYRARIVALAGDRTAVAAALAEAAQRLHDQAGGAASDQALAAVMVSWRALRAPLGGQAMNWLAADAPAVAAAEQAAAMAVVTQLRSLLEPYLGKAAGSYGETLPDEAMLAWLDRQSEEVNRTRPGLQARVRAARTVLAEFSPHYHFEPFVDIACATALRYHHLPAGGIVIGLLVVVGLAGGLWFTIIRMVRGPMPVDVNAETMENVEPIDLDTDAETRSRSSASITDVG